MPRGEVVVHIYAVNPLLNLTFNTFQKFLPKQLRHSVSFVGTWLLHPRVLTKMHTKLWFSLNYLEYAAPIWSPYSKLQINRVEKVQRTAARWTGPWTCSGHLYGSSLLLFHKIHCGAVSIDKDKYLTPAHSLITQCPIL